MNKIVSTLLFAGALLTTSCVDLVQEPQSWITKENYIQLPQDISQLQKATSGLYNNFWGNNYGFNCRMMRINTAADQIVTSPKPNNVMLLIQNLTPNPTVNNALSNGLTPIYRYADALLIYAEASTQATGTVNTLALQCLNDVQRRAGSTITPQGVSTADFDKAVLDEKGWEFLAEYKRWFDLVRREKLSGVKTQYAGSIFQKNNSYLFPVPVEQIQMTGWNNNPGY